MKNIVNEMSADDFQENLEKKLEQFEHKKYQDMTVAEMIIAYQYLDLMNHKLFIREK